MKDFAVTLLPGRVVFGAGRAREVLLEEVERLGGERVLLVAAAAERALAETLAAPLGNRIAGVFAEALPHVPVATAEAAEAAARAAGADLVLCVGGGSTTGAAKAIALATGLPILAVPTTYAGSEMTPVWGLTRDGRKTTGRDDRVLPRTVVYDPELTVGLPAAVTAASAINALAHCVEAFYAPGANPVTSLLAEEGVRAIAAGAPDAVRRPEDIGARSDTLYGAWLAGAAFAVAGSDLHHKLCHVLGGGWDLPHADTHAVVLPQVAAVLEPVLPAAMGRVARALGDRGADGAALGLHRLAVELGAPTALAALGMPESGLPEAARLAAEALPASTPGPASAEDLLGVLRAAFEGRVPAATTLTQEV